MNKNNLSWVDNKVFSNSGAAPTPYMPPSPAAVSPTGVSPATMSPAQGLSPATYQDMMSKMPPAPAPAGVSPATYQDMMQKMPPAPTPAGVSPATYQDMTGNQNQMGMPQPTGGSPATMSPAQYMPMTGNAPNNMGNMPSGVSPATYAKDPVIYPVQTGLPAPGTGMSTPGMGMPGGVAGAATGMGMPGTLTRDITYGPSPISIQGPPTVLDPGYIPAYLRTQIGKRVRAEFNIGTNLYIDRTGFLREVGISYFVLEDYVTRVRIMCDLYSLKFLTSDPS